MSNYAGASGHASNLRAPTLVRNDKRASRTAARPSKSSRCRPTSSQDGGCGTSQTAVTFMVLSLEIVVLCAGVEMLM